MSRPVNVLVLLMLVLALTRPSQAQMQLDDVRHNYAQALDEVSLFNHDSTLFSLGTYRNNELTVYIFLGHECPICQKYGHKLRSFDKRFDEQNIELIGVVPLRDVSITTISNYAARYNFEFPILSDRQRVLTELFHATVTPEIVMIDNEGNLIYRGMIDNWFYALGKYRKITTAYYLEDAINAYLKGEDVSIKQTEPIGCFINMTSYTTN